MKNRVLNYDFETLPQVPFSIYFLNKDGEVSPKKIFTVTEKVIDRENAKIEFFIRELQRKISYNPEHIILVSQYHVN